MVTAGGAWGELVALTEEVGDLLHRGQQTSLLVEPVLQLLSACHEAGLCRRKPPHSCAQLRGFDASGDPLFEADFCTAVLLSLTCDLTAKEDEQEEIEEEQRSAVAAAVASARFCIQQPASQKQVAADFVRALQTEAFSQRRLRELRAAQQRKENCDDTGGTQAVDFATPAEDNRAIDALYNCVIAEAAPVLQASGFSASPLGLNAFFGALHACGYGSLIRAAVPRVWHAGESLEPLILPPSSECDGKGQTLVVAFSSLGSGVVRPEWRGTLQGRRELAADEAGSKLAVAHALDPACSWFCTDPDTGMWDGGAAWQAALNAACASYRSVCFLGDSMGGTAALRFAHLATGSVIAFTPQVNLANCPVRVRPDFSADLQAQLRESVVSACLQSSARIVVHVGLDAYDVEQVGLLPHTVDVIRHEVDSHLLSMKLKEEGKLEHLVHTALQRGGTDRASVDSAVPGRMNSAPEPWSVASWTQAADVSRNVQAYGFCRVEAQTVDAETLAELRVAAAERFADVRTAVEERRAAGETLMDFVEAVERDGKRWDVRHRMREPPFAALLENPPWSQTLCELLGPSHRLLFSGMVIALPTAGGEHEVSSSLLPLRPQSVPSGPSTETWITVGAKQCMRCSGQLYHEVKLGKGACQGEPQVGWLSAEFVEGDFDGNGVGDDACGWAADGVRHTAWHDGQVKEVVWPTDWHDGDVVGCAVDIDAGKMLFALNGEWVPAAEMSFTAAEVPIFPAVSMRGAFSMHVPKTTWQFAPPTDSYQAWADDGVFDRPRLAAESQGWHQDGAPLWPHAAVSGPLPVHCVNVFVPLVDVGAANGATEFLPGSHLLDQGAEADLEGRVQPPIAAGASIMFDYRVSHRGGVNLSAEERVVLYFTYAVPWFRDHTNHQSTRSLFGSEPGASSGEGLS